jgi:hypothetical protein
VLEALHEADPDPDRAEQSVRLDRPDPRRRANQVPLERRRVPCVAVSPLIGGLTVKGPAAGMLQRLQGGTTAAHLANCYPGLIDVLVIGEEDATTPTPFQPRRASSNHAHAHA